MTEDKVIERTLNDEIYDWTVCNTVKHDILKLGAIYHYFSKHYKRLTETKVDDSEWEELFYEMMNVFTPLVIDSTLGINIYIEWAKLDTYKEKLVALYESIDPIITERYPYVVDQTIRWKTSSILRWLGTLDTRPSVITTGQSTSTFMFETADRLEKLIEEQNHGSRQ